MARVLLIEDSADIRENTEELLELHGYEVIIAQDGLEGVEKAKNHLPNVIICDIIMPNLDGYGVVEQITTDPNTKDIPFIFCTASAQKNEIERGINSGAIEYITKPYEIGELLKILERVID